MSSREQSPPLGDHLGRAELADLLVAVAGLPARRAGERRLVAVGWPASMAAEIGIWLMFCTPPATTRSLVPLMTAWAAKWTACWTAAALAVDGGARHVLGQAGHQPAGAGDVAGLRADRVDAAEHDVVDGTRVDAGAVHEGRQRVAAEVGRMDLRQAAAAASDRGAHGIDDDRPRTWRESRSVRGVPRSCRIRRFHRVEFVSGGIDVDVHVKLEGHGPRRRTPSGDRRAAPLQVDGALQHHARERSWRRSTARS